MSDVPDDIYSISQVYKEVYLFTDENRTKWINFTKVLLAKYYQG